MDSFTRSSVIVMGAGISGISAAKKLAENGVEDLVILEASDRIGGRIRKQEFGGVHVGTGAGWIQGVGGKESNPVWDLAATSGLRTCFSDYSNVRFNIYDRSGKIIPRSEAAELYDKAVENAIRGLKIQEDKNVGHSALLEQSRAPSTPIELAIDFVLHDFEMAEVEPLATYTDFGEREFLVADERGYEFLLHKMAQDFLITKDGKIVDDRLKLNKHMENAYPGSNILVVTLTNQESKRVEAQSDSSTLMEAMGCLRDMFGPDIPKASEFSFPSGGTTGSSAVAIVITPFSPHNNTSQLSRPQLDPFFFTNERFNAYVHGGYLSGLETSEALLKVMNEERNLLKENIILPGLKESFVLETLLASFGFSQQQFFSAIALQIWDMARQLLISGKLFVQQGIK